MNLKESESINVVNQISLLNKLITLKIHEKDDKFLYCLSDLIDTSIDNLFQASSNTNPLPYIHSNKERKHVLSMLLNLTALNSEFSLQIISRLGSYYECEEKEYLYYQIGNIKQNNKAVGIRNMGNTCYLNSIIHQLFNIKDFCSNIINTTVSSNEEPAIKIYNQLKYLFSDMKLSIFDFVNTKKFCTDFTAFDGCPINSNYQQDANEFFNLLLDSVENALKTVNNNFVKTYFTGTFENCINSTEDEYPFKRIVNELFVNISLDIRNKKHLFNALDSYTKVYTLDDDNKYFCEEYNRKIKVQKQHLIKDLPQNLVFVLNRFEYDSNMHQRKKLNDYLEFPFELNMQRWMVKSDQLGHRDRKDLDYILTGVLVHSGVAESGHYYSYIKDGDKWFEYNDTIVTQKEITMVK